MPHPRKLHESKEVVFVTTRMLEGLPMVCKPYMVLILKSILALAQLHYPVTLCHFIFMGNHLHLLIVLTDPTLLKDFVGFVKKRITDAVNHLRGTTGSLWEEGYDSAVLLKPQDVLNKICYLYCNPTTAGLVSSIEEYPGLSSWSMYHSGTTSEQCDWIKLSMLPELSRQTEHRAGIKEEISSQVKTKLTLKLDPWAWVNTFEELVHKPVSEIKSEINDKITLQLKLTEEERKGKPYLGAARLCMASIFEKYRPTKFGRRSVCISSDREAKISYLSRYKLKLKQCRDVFLARLQGASDLLYPPGAFEPSMPPRWFSFRGATP